MAAFGGARPPEGWSIATGELAETPTVFPRDIAGNPAVLKAVIEA